MYPDNLPSNVLLGAAGGDGRAEMKWNQAVFKGAVRHSRFCAAIFTSVFPANSSSVIKLLRSPTMCCLLVENEKAGGVMQCEFTALKTRGADGVTPSPKASGPGAPISRGRRK